MPTRSRKPRRRSATRAVQSSSPTSASSLTRLWVLRAMIRLGGYRPWLDLEYFKDSSNSLALALGFHDDLDSDDDNLSRRAALTRLRRQHAQAENDVARAVLPKALAANCSRIAALIGLDAVSQQLLAFAVLLHQDELLAEATELLGVAGRKQIYTVVATLLGVRESSVHQAFAPAGPLAQSGLVKIDHDHDLCLRGKVDLLSGNFAERMVAEVSDPLELFRDAILPASPAELSPADFTHVQPLLDIVIPLLRRALATGRSGVNVLLHGKPGTGKSQLARVLAAALERPLFQVSSEDEDGDPIGGEKRLRAYRTALCLVVRSSALLVFDEAEDVFAGGWNFFAAPSPAQTSKAWVNRTLEGNPVPCLWLSNAIGDMDPAFIRRFDVVYELPIPPRRQRARLIEGLCRDLAPPAVIGRLASSEHLAPAVIARAATVARTLRDEVPPEALPAVLTRLIDHTLMAQGHPPLPPESQTSAAGGFDPACAPADTDLTQLAAGIARVPSARMCLYGPPGTGKTAFAHWLAQQLDKPLLIRRVSDLIGAYLGESERNLAQAFRDASDEQAILLLDEVDSFLLDRQYAERSWEVTLVNEMLMQMEVFTGVFIAATNRMEHLDPAALRRFDLKLRFDYLQPDQSWTLLQRHAEALGLPAPNAFHKVALSALPSLTPGDFATVARQARFRPFRDTDALVAALVAECDAKPGGRRRPIGFL